MVRVKLMYLDSLIFFVEDIHVHVIIQEISTLLGAQGANPETPGQAPSL